MTRNLIVRGATFAALCVLMLATIDCQPKAETLPTDPKVDTKTLEYKSGDTICDAFIAWPKDAKGSLPGVMVVHDWMGPSEFSHKKVIEIAKLGYVAFGADIYGKGVRPKNADEASNEAGKFFGDRKLLRARAQAALDTLKAQDHVDKAKIAAIGFCFGGTTVLELARSGAELSGIVSFHGNLGSEDAKEASNIKCKVLVLHGADDPFAPQEQVNEFITEMRATKVDWQLQLYANAVHAFTEPQTGNDNSKGAAYNPLADKRSWIDMQQFFDETLK